MNKIILIGRLTKDVDVKNTGDTTVAKYSLAVNRSFKKEGQPDADFINCVAFGKSAEFAEKFFQKGQQVAVVGRIQTGSYKNKEGVTVYTTDVVVEEQHFADSKKDGKTGSTAPSGGKAPSAVDDSEDDLPF
jgi:single-strand DNA-binding protein